MKLSVLVSLLLAAGTVVWAEQPMPKMVTVDPLNGKAGDVVVATGENLQKDAVAKLYLTDGKNDIACEMIEQTGTTIKFKIPVKAPQGARLTVMVLTTGKDAKYIEQPVKLEIDEP
ncbi:MAG: IPT/TIG domain-containing protein [Bryobacteraceae bacterium]|jgi:hypothetical protein